jgi:hypothetical protein
MKTCVFFLFHVVSSTWKIVLTNNGNAKYKDTKQINEEEDSPAYSVSIISSAAIALAILVQAVVSSSCKGLLETST